MVAVLSSSTRVLEPEQTAFSPVHVVILAWGPGTGVGVSAGTSVRRFLLPQFGLPAGHSSASLVHGADPRRAVSWRYQAMSSLTGKAIIASLRQQQNLSDYRKTHWEGSFEEYLDIVAEHPEVTRTAYQRLYDMILSHGTEEVFETKEKVIRYKFFTEYAAKHGDGIYGIDRPLMQLVNAFKSAAKGYGTERRVLLLHGPVGSSKSTIARLLKRGLEDYARTDAGMLFSFAWKGHDGAPSQKCPMHEDPLNLVPHDLRPMILGKLNANHKSGDLDVTIRGDLCPFCRQMFNERLAQHDGDWSRMLEDIKVYRLILSEQDRIGVGTFQPKDEKNQDSTELTGDINYRKIAEYGTDSDARAFNFDGELNIANRPGRVHRGAQARRRVPLRPARGQPGAQDQAEEVRPDRHRRGHPRTHQRAGISALAEQ
jgi:hypothetical protein